ncbi:hypothetical protein Tco_0733112 [Tanacetum coccineum]
MKITVSTIEFLGAVIREGNIKLQPHIIKKIVNFNEEELKTKKGLRSFLGDLNYARNHIPKLGILLRPLYEKTNAHEDKRLKSSDYEIVRNSQMEKEQGRSMKFRKIYAYASGKFSTTQSTIDAEINACINTLEKLNIYNLDEQEVTLRTDCQAIIKCTGEMKQLAGTALYSVEEVLQSPNAFQKNMKITCEESPRTLKFQQQRNQSKPCEVYKQSYNAKPKSALVCQLKTATGPTKEKTSEFKTKKPEESLLNWNPLPSDWAAKTSKPKEVQDYTPEDNM